MLSRLLILPPFIFAGPLIHAQLTSTQIVVEGDMLFRPDASFIAPTPARLWTNSTVPWVIDPDIPNPERITDGFAFYNQNAPVKFQPRGSETNFVHLVRSTIGNGVCTSNVGMVGGEQFIHVEDACTTSSLIHEMGHTAGFFHEQSRSDRNLFVTVLYENINKNAYNDFLLQSPPNSQDVGVYDYASHMHYASFGFSVNNDPTIQTVPAGIPLNPYPVLSPGDLDTLFRMYGPTPTQTTIVSDPPNLRLTIDGQIVNTPQTLNWAPGSVHTVSADSQSNSTNRFLFGNWSDGGTATHTITADPSVTFYSANFIQQVQVKVGVAASGGGTASLVQSSADGYFASQTIISMTATPSAGYSFLNWTGASCPRGNAASPTSFVTAAVDISCTAVFTQSPVNTIVTSPSVLPVIVDNASHAQTPVNLIWNPGTTHTLSTTAPVSYSTSDKRFVFESWSDGGAATHTVTASSSPTTYTASYRTQYLLVPPGLGTAQGSITINPPSADGFYDSGTQIQITSVPGPGFTFYRWTGDLAGQPNPATITMDSEKSFGVVVSTVVPPLTFANSASAAIQSAAPGELISLYGTNIGPASPGGGQLNAGGTFPTSVNGTSVTFNGVAAPLTYVGPNQINAVVPYEVTGANAAAVVVQSASSRTTGSIGLDVTSPGVFTSNARGTGQAAVLNQNGTLNSSSNPAPRGSVVTFYATGAGTLSPGAVDGSLTALPLPALTQPLSVRIGGKPAILQYAGPAPTQVSGLVQINAVIPDDAPSGNDSVYLIIGKNGSPPAVTVAVP